MCSFVGRPIGASFPTSARAHTHTHTHTQSRGTLTNTHPCNGGKKGFPPSSTREHVEVGKRVWSPVVEG